MIALKNDPIYWSPPGSKYLGVNTAVYWSHPCSKYLGVNTAVVIFVNVL
jgi:hypothetical protein